MINLLPYDNKKQIHAARFNVVLGNCLTLIICSIIFMALSCASSYAYLNKLKANANNTTSSASNTASEDSVTTLTKASSIRADLATAQTVLNKRVSYYKILTAISSALPTGVILDSLSVKDATINSPITINLHSKTNDISNTITQNFRNNTLFSKAVVKSINTTSDNQNGYNYAVTVIININRANAV